MNAALAQWYASQSGIRRLWAFRDVRGIRIFVTLEPTQDGDDIYPTWMAHGRKWVRELEILADGPVKLEVVEEAFPGRLAASVDGVLVAQLFGRDSNIIGDSAADIAFATIDGRR